MSGGRRDFGVFDERSFARARAFVLDTLKLAARPLTAHAIEKHTELRSDHVHMSLEYMEHEGDVRRERERDGEPIEWLWTAIDRAPRLRRPWEEL